ncbi:MAG: hypothetical protein AB2807_08555 [Candidatus Sedimenticola endophacoides]
MIMSEQVEQLLARMRALEEELEQEFAKQWESFHYRLERGRVTFERWVVERHRLLKTGLPRFIVEARIEDLVAAPFIYVMAVPVALLDLFLWLYQSVVFGIYRIPRVRRGDFVIIDRHQLAYLNGIEKFNCVFCGYANGVFGWARQIAARSEQYWCPIKHARRVASPHGRYPRFFEYGDGEGFRQRLGEMRGDLRRGK